MNQKFAELGAQSQPVWLQIIGSLVLFFAFSFFILYLAASFTANPKADGSVIVNDEANILAPQTETAIRGIKFPEGIPAVVRTISSIPDAEIGTFATDLMYKEPHWQTLRPRGWLRKYLRQDLPSGPGVYVLVSLEPQLLQIRYGREIRLSAYQQMIAAGTWYREQQRFERDTLDLHILETVKELAQRMQKVADPPWPLNWAQYLSSLIASEIEDILSPSDGLFSNEVLKKYIMLAHNVGATDSAWRFVAFSLATFILLRFIVKKLLIVQILLPHIKRTWLRVSLVILINLGLLGVLVTSFASLAALSKGRVEDQLALEALGLSFLSTTGFEASLFTVRGGLWLAIPGILVSFVGEVIQAAEAQKHGELRFTFGWLVWGCALFLLPKAIAIAALVILIWNTGSVIVQNFSRDSTV